MTDWERMSPNEIRATGVLYAVNKHVLWPLGLALGVAISDEADPPDGVWVVALRQAETIEEGVIDPAKEPEGCHPAERFARFVEARIAEMPTEMEQAMARKQLRAILPDPRLEKQG